MTRLALILSIIFTGSILWAQTDSGWDPSQLQKLSSYAKRQNSSGLILLEKGQLVLEKHFDIKNKNSEYLERVIGETEEGHIIEDVASVQKSIVSILMGIAQEKDLLSLEDKVSDHLGRGWSKAKAHQEDKIQIYHLMTMTSGLDKSGRFEKPPGRKWLYNTRAYSKLMDVLIAASGKKLNELTSEWLTGPLEMKNSFWIERDKNVSVNPYGFATTARDLASFGQMVLNKGQWNNQQIISEDYLAAVTRPSQELNPKYGHLWWVGQGRVRTAPMDLFAAHGNLERRIYIVPSLELVVVRIGAEPNASKAKFDRKIWKLIMSAQSVSTKNPSTN